MAITQGAGTATLGGSVSSLAATAFSVTSGQAICVGVALGSTGASVSGVTDTIGNTYTQKSFQNGTGLRIEMWVCASSSGTNASNVVTATITGGPTFISIAAESYNAVSTFTAANTGTSSDGGTSSQNMPVKTTVAETNNWVVAAFVIASVSGDVLSAVQGTLRQSAVPGASGVAVALIDYIALSTGVAQEIAFDTNARKWAAATIELRAGGAAVTFNDLASGLSSASSILGTLVSPSPPATFAAISREVVGEPLFCRDAPPPTTSTGGSYTWMSS